MNEQWSISSAPEEDSIMPAMERLRADLASMDFTTRSLAVDHPFGVIMAAMAAGYLVRRVIAKVVGD